MDKQILSRFEDDMQLRGLAPSTKEAYGRHVRKYVEFIAKPFEESVQSDPNRYLLHLRRDRGLSAQTQNQCAAALRFLYSVTLDKPWSTDKILYRRAKGAAPFSVCVFLGRGAQIPRFQIGKKKAGGDK